ncbi:hypothetical protein QOZ80_8AG0629730 [Eleusine coracana subsp. coracana]|nr:hypothetical protein QOZ80_8AG0629730 [Eleusine coracana subsp. coracana]
MAEIALGSVERIVKVALAIKEAVETVKQNAEECLDIERCVARVSALLKRLDETTETMKDEVMSHPLEDLADSVERALELVEKCQRKNKLGRFLGAGDMAKELRRAQDDILRKVTMGSFATNVQLTSLMLTNIQPIAARSEVKGKKEMTNDVATGSEAPFARPLPGIAKFSLSELKEATNHFSEQNIIGRGGFVTVYKGKLSDGLPVVIKKINISPEFLRTRMSEELDIVLKLQHKNIVKRLGYCHEVETKSMLYKGTYIVAEERHYCFVEEYLLKGSLETIDDGPPVNWSSRVQIIEGVARGLHYLHEQDIVHMDVKPANILLDSDMNPKIADFGLAVRLDHDDNEITRGNSLRGTMGYLAPEYLAQGLLSSKCDVYGFGIVLLMVVRGMCKSKSDRH